MTKSVFRSLLVGTTSFVAVELMAMGSAALAQNAPAEKAASEQTAGSVEEVVVTGSRIVREGYEAPTPLTVVGTEQIQGAAAPNIMTFLSSLPALSGSSMTTNNQVCTACGTAGLQNVNLRSLGASRALVLLDGQRVVGSSYNGVPDIGSFPQQLVARVDVVTGGASAVYGSDAVGGVVNFILDHKFTGVKGEISGGLTNYGDDKNYKVNLSAGFGFADDRGHVLLSGEHLHNAGVQGDNGREWNRVGYQQISNPAYTATNGQPALTVQYNTGLSTATPGGLIISGPLKGTAFGVGGTVFKYNYGSIFSNPYMVGGDWQMSDLRPTYDLDPLQTDDTLFSRVSYDITDNISAFVQYNWSQNHIHNSVNRIWMLGGAATSPVVKVDNAYLPTSVRAAMVAAGVTTFQLGTLNQDLGTFQANNYFIGNRVNAGLEGTFNAFDTAWHWNAYYAYGSTKQDLTNPPGPVISMFKESTDAVVNPATGQIVCRVTLTNAASTCKPWNVMGIGVNDIKNASFLRPNFTNGLIQQQTYSASVSGEPISLWAGPVSLALSIEHRKDEIHSIVDTYSTAADRPAGNYAALNGAQSVTEGAVETLIPLAKNESWAQALDLSLAARFTGYELSGFVTTWKVGVTYTPVDEFKFRATRSRDIRAPNLQELFATPAAIAGSVVIDRFLGGISYPLDYSLMSSNANLVPEKADTTGLGVVFTPSFLTGFTMSVDFWDVDISGAIQNITFQQVMDSCYNGTRTDLCSVIVRNPSTGRVSTIAYFPINLASQDVRGLDFEASYRMGMSEIVSEWRGNLSLHGLMTMYLRNYQDNKFNAPFDHAGENSGSGVPNWKLNVTATYALDPVTVGLTARAVSSGAFNNSFVVCTTGCPTSSSDHQTINYNHMAGAFYLDANVSYKLDMGISDSELFFSVKNMFNHNPPPSPGAFYQSISATAGMYDPLGVVYRAGLRFKM